MTRLAIAFLAAWVPLAALAQTMDEQPAGEGPTATPQQPAPSEAPPAPPASPPAPPSQPRAAQQAPPGQWVYTQQYGWIWIPYGETYSYVPPEGVGVPYEYVYYPVYGWTWVTAPWIWGIGPWPYFAIGPTFFAWYQFGWWRTPWRWHYRPGPLRGAVAGYPAVPYRGGPAVRPAPAWRGGATAPARSSGGARTRGTRR